MYYIDVLITSDRLHPKDATRTEPFRRVARPPKRLVPRADQLQEVLDV
jgi:hypothetical protein